MLITYQEITDTTRIARSTIQRRVRALGITPTKQPLNGRGRMANALTVEQYIQVCEFIPDYARNNEYKTPAEKSEQVKSKFEKTKTHISENRVKGLYTRLTEYGGLYNAKDWTA